MNLKNALLVSLLMVGASGVVSAQSATNWTGVYLGANAGYGFGKSNVTTSTTFTGSYFPNQALVDALNANGSGSVKPSGFTGGITFGYNAQSSNTVYGFEMDVNSFSMKGDRSISSAYLGYPNLGYTIHETTKVGYLATFRGRIGYATGQSLWFGTAGLATTSIKVEDSFSDFSPSPGAESASQSKSKVGWTLGGGYEFDMQNKWSFKAEILYVSFGKVNVDGGPYINWATIPNTPFTHSADLKSEVIRVGFNYRF